MTAISGVAYTLIANPLLALPLILVEATGFAILFPALYAVVAAGSPTGRSSTAQGLFGAAGTVGFIVASLIAGQLARNRHPAPVLDVRRHDAGNGLAIGLAIGDARPFASPRSRTQSGRGADAVRDEFGLRR